MPFGFIVRLRPKAIPAHRSISASCTTKDLVYRKTTPKPSNGIVAPLIKASLRG